MSECGGGETGTNQVPSNELLFRRLVSITAILLCNITKIEICIVFYIGPQMEGHVPPGISGPEKNIPDGTSRLGCDVPSGTLHVLFYFFPFVVFTCTHS